MHSRIHSALPIKCLTRVPSPPKMPLEYLHCYNRTVQSERIYTSRIVSTSIYESFTYIKRYTAILNRRSQDITVTDSAVSIYDKQHSKSLYNPLICYRTIIHEFCNNFTLIVHVPGSGSLTFTTFAELWIFSNSFSPDPLLSFLPEKTESKYTME